MLKPKKALIDRIHFFIINKINRKQINEHILHRDTNT